jgi:hypothetical protein
VLDTSTFETVYTPTATEFERLQNDLGGALEDLDTRIGKTIGSPEPDA